MPVPHRRTGGRTHTSGYSSGEDKSWRGGDSSVLHAHWLRDTHNEGGAPIKYGSDSSIAIKSEKREVRERGKRERERQMVCIVF